MKQSETIEALEIVAEDDGLRKEFFRRVIVEVLMKGKMAEIRCKLSSTVGRCGQIRLTLRAEVA